MQWVILFGPVEHEPTELLSETKSVEFGEVQRGKMCLRILQANGEAKRCPTSISDCDVLPPANLFPDPNLPMLA